ncbi:MAG: AbrB/MazE/SpoVT family DNA-binding domain-containing protein [Candidatus Bathyarchaeia archaeon]
MRVGGLEVATTKVSSKGQVVIPADVKRAVGIREGERLLVIALGDTILLKRMTGKTFEETVKPVWDKARQVGLTEEDVDALIREAEAQSRP